MSMFPKKRFEIDLFASSFESSSTLLAEHLRHVRRQEPEWIPDEAEIDNDREIEDPLEEMHDWALRPFLPIFHEIAPLDPSQKYTLNDYLFAEEFHYTVQVVEEKLVPVYLSNTKRMQPSSVDYSSFSVYHPREVQVPISADSAALPAIPRKLFIHRRPRPSFFKLVYWGDAGILIRDSHLFKDSYS